MEKKDIYKELIKPFPEEAYSKDGSRGFDLTSLKAQYIKERLNEVFGIFNWEFSEKFVPGQSGVLCHGTLTVHAESFTNPDNPDDLPIPFDEDAREVEATGWSPNKNNLGDTYKGASTDALSKASSFIGIGNEVFKGNVNLSTVKEKPKVSNSTQPPVDNGPYSVPGEPSVPYEPVCPKCGAATKISKSGKRWVCVNAKFSQVNGEWQNEGCNGFVKAEPKPVDDIPF